MEARHAPNDRAGALASPTLPFLAIVLAMLPAVLDQTILSTALPTIASDLGTLADVSWVFTAYVIAAAASTPLWGKLGDRYGRKRLLQVSLGGFLIASALCGLASGIGFLIATRVVQGLACGGLMTLAMAAVGDIVEPQQRGRYQGYIAAIFAGATVLGPLLGGLLVDGPGWRWVFYVNLPLGLAALFGLALKLPDRRPEDRARATGPLDLAGAALLAGAATTLMLACAWAGERFPWASLQVIGLIAASFALAGLLIVREMHAADPVVPLSLLASRPVAVAGTAMFLATAALFAVTVFVPLFLQTTTGATPTEAGLLLVPMMAGVVVATNVSGRLVERDGRLRRFPITGLAVMTLALTGLAVVSGSPSQLETGAWLLLFGLGFGMVTQMLLVAVQNSVDRKVLGVATATTSFFRAIGGAVGAAVLGAVFAASSGLGSSASSVGGLGAAERAGLLDGIQTVFAVAAPIAALGLVVALFLRDPEPEARGHGPAGAAGASA
jgi:EmrB/QacA subfamily drug resistance transporter